MAFPRARWQAVTIPRWSSASPDYRRDQRVWRATRPRLQLLTQPVYALHTETIEQVDVSKYNGTTQFYFQVTIKTSNAAKPTIAFLYNMTDGAMVPGSTVSTTSTGFTRARSGALSLSGAKDYQAKFGGRGSGIVHSIIASDIVDTRTA